MGKKILTYLTSGMFQFLKKMYNYTLYPYLYTSRHYTIYVMS